MFVGELPVTRDGREARIEPRHAVDGIWIAGERVQCAAELLSRKAALPQTCAKIREVDVLPCQSLSVISTRRLGGHRHDLQRASEISLKFECVGDSRICAG